MKQNFYIIHANIPGCRKTMYFTGIAKNGMPLFSTHKTAALPFLSMNEATNFRLAVAPQKSQLELLETVNYVPPPEEKKDASGFTKFKH